jgi:signal transduction histidine kinase
MEVRSIKNIKNSNLRNVKAKAIEAWVRDTGDRITEQVRDKIFQPFFTTKPTGQGTGLGLSLSYDIVKVHGGELKLENSPTDVAGKGGDGSEFIIHLPI